MDVIGYLRVSTHEQGYKTGLMRQKNSIQAFCESNCFDLTQVFEERISGVRADRPAFQEMMVTAKEKNAEGIIVEDLTRLARELMVQLNLCSFIASKDLKLWVANTGECVTESMMEDPMRRALVQMQGVFSELEKSMLLRRMTRGKEILKKTGMRNGNPILKRTMDGSLKVEGKRRLTEIYPDLLEVAVQLKKSGTTWREIRRELFRRGYSTTKGTELRQANLQRIFKEPKFRGMLPG